MSQIYLKVWKTTLPRRTKSKQWQVWHGTYKSGLTHNWNIQSNDCFHKTEAWICHAGAVWHDRFLLPRAGNSFSSAEVCHAAADATAMGHTLQSSFTYLFSSLWSHNHKFLERTKWEVYRYDIHCDVFNDSLFSDVLEIDCRCLAFRGMRNEWSTMTCACVCTFLSHCGSWCELEANNKVTMNEVVKNEFSEWNFARAADNFIRSCKLRTCSIRNMHVCIQLIHVGMSEHQLNCVHFSYSWHIYMYTYIFAMFSCFQIRQHVFPQEL